MYFIGIDISKYKHDCFIVSSEGEAPFGVFSFENNKAGFEMFLDKLNLLDSSEEKRIGFESTSHYSLNLKLFLEKHNYTFMEFQPALISQYGKALTLRKTKTDAIDSQTIARWLMNVDYKPYPHSFYHNYSLKSLTRLRFSLIKQRNLYLIKLTDILDHTFPEFKPFFNDRFGVTALHILEKYGNPTKIANMRTTSYDELRRISRGKFSMQKFLKLKELAKDTVGESNHIFELELSCVLRLYKQIDDEITKLEEKITVLTNELNRPTMTIPGVGVLSAAVILSEYGDVTKFKSPAQMLSFAGLEPGYYQSGQSEHTGHMVKRGSSHLKCAIMNCCLPLIQFNMVFAEFYAKKRSEGKPHRVALSHVAKKLIRVIYTLETTNQTFDADKLR
jgi:transposase